MRVSEIMNKAFVVDKDISLKECADIMSDKSVGSLILMSKDEIKGIITERDIIKCVKNLSKKMSSVMAKKVVTIDSKENIEVAAEMMAENKIKRLPVLNNGKLVGVVTATDLIANSDALNENFLLD